MLFPTKGKVTIRVESQQSVSKHLSFYRKVKVVEELNKHDQVVRGLLKPRRQEKKLRHFLIVFHGTLQYSIRS